MEAAVCGHQTVIPTATRQAAATMMNVGRTKTPMATYFSSVRVE
jgi:hypothetical protein